MLLCSSDKFIELEIPPDFGNGAANAGIPLARLLWHVPAQGLMTLLAGLLLERRVILVAPSTDMVSAAIHAAAALLYPFTWQHIYLPLLPMSLKVKHFQNSSASSFTSAGTHCDSTQHGRMLMHMLIVQHSAQRWRMATDALQGIASVAILCYTEHFDALAVLAGRVQHWCAKCIHSSVERACQSTSANSLHVQAAPKTARSQPLHHAAMAYTVSGA